MTTLVGAYAALHGLGEADHATVYEALRSDPGVGGFELPFTRPWTASDAAEAASRLGSEGRAILTTIPGLVRGSGDDPRFGPASEHEDGRRAAVVFLHAAHGAARMLTDLIGPERVWGVAIASSPRRDGLDHAAGATAFATSLTELLDGAGDGVRTIVEHCDALVGEHPPAKGYLDLGTEIAVIEQVTKGTAGIGIGINWGRSAIEGRGADRALEHVRRAAESGMLASLVFSGCSDAASGFGAAWADVHTPSRAEEHTSLLTAERIDACLTELPTDVTIGIKISAPRAASARERAELLLREVRRVEGARQRAGMQA